MQLRPAAAFAVARLGRLVGALLALPGRGRSSDHDFLVLSGHAIVDAD